MINLLQNPELKPGMQGVPMYYSVTGPFTYDDFVIDGYRTCSITMPNGKMAMAGYDDFLNIAGKKNLQLGLNIRAIDISGLFFVVEFYNSDRDLINDVKKNVTSLVTDNFDEVFDSYAIPQNAAYAKVQCAFFNKVTACTFYNPRVYAV